MINGGDGVASTHSSDDGKDGTSDTDVVKGANQGKKIVKVNKNYTDCQKFTYVSCDLADIGAFYVNTNAKIVQKHALYK